MEREFLRIKTAPFFFGLLSSVVSLLIAITSSYAGSMGPSPSWHPLIAIGAGTATPTSLGKAQSFPIQNPITDEFYDYYAGRSKKTVGLADIFFAAERQIGPNWILQLGIDFSQTSRFSTNGIFVQGADAQSADTYTYHYRVQARQLLVEGKLLYPMQNGFYPYVVAGAGAAFNKAYNYYTSVPPTLTFTRMYQNNTQTSFGYLFGLGVDKDICPHLRLGIGYRFAGSGKIKFGTTFIDTTIVSGTLSQSHLNSNQFLAQLTWLI